MKTKFFKVVELSSDNEMTTLATLDTENEAIEFIHAFNGGFFQLTILTVWE